MNSLVFFSTAIFCFLTCFRGIYLFDPEAICRFRDIFQEINTTEDFDPDIQKTSTLKTSTRNYYKTLCFTKIILSKSGKICLGVQQLLFFKSYGNIKSFFSPKIQPRKSEISVQPIRGIFLWSKTYNSNWIHADIVSWVPYGFFRE